MSEKKLIDQIVNIHLEVMDNKVGMAHTFIEFWFCSHCCTGGNFFWFEDDGVTSTSHPDLDGLEFRDRVKVFFAQERKIHSLLEQAREQDKKSGLPMRNVYDMKVFRDGRHEFQFYHNAELAAEQLARTEESERKEAELRKQKQAEREALSKENKQPTLTTDQTPEETDEYIPDRYEILRHKIYRKEDNIWHAEEFLRYQAALVAPEGWEEIRIEMIEESENRSRMDQWYRLEGTTEFKRLHGRSSMDVVDAIEHWRVRKDNGDNRFRNVRFTLSPIDVEMHNAIRYEWDVG